MRISDWSSDVCSSDLHGAVVDARVGPPQQLALDVPSQRRPVAGVAEVDDLLVGAGEPQALQQFGAARHIVDAAVLHQQMLGQRQRSEEHTSELQSLMRISYAVFCLKKKNILTHNITATCIINKLNTY